VLPEPVCSDDVSSALAVEDVASANVVAALKRAIERTFRIFIPMRSANDAPVASVFPAPR